jgi:hypothetical protein
MKNTLPVCVLLLSTLAPPALATSLDPGQTLRVSDLTTALIQDHQWATHDAVLYYRGEVTIPPYAVTSPNYGFYHVINSGQVTLADGRQPVYYAFNEPHFGEEPFYPGARVNTVQPLPADTTITLRGFSQHSLDITLAGFVEVSLESRIGTISRSLDGDTVTFGTFSNAPTFLESEFGGAHFFAFDAPALAFAPGTATVRFTDLEGLPRTHEVAVLLPTGIPEPSTVGTLLLALAALGARMQYRLRPALPAQNP